MKLKQEGHKLYGKVDYKSVTADGLKISIENIFSLNETGAYFDWGLEKCGFGQFSFSYSEGKWTIMNECMGPETSGLILKAFEEAVRATQDEKAIYCLNRIISLISYHSNSLDKAILLIWKSAKTEGGEIESFEETIKDYEKELKREAETEKNLVLSKQVLTTEDTTLQAISTNHYSFTNKTGSFYEASLSMFFNIKYVKYGFLTMTQRINLNTDEVEWIVNDGIQEKELGNIIKVLEDNNEGEYHKIWDMWKTAVKINGGPLKMAQKILLDSQRCKVRYPNR